MLGIGCSKVVRSAQCGDHARCSLQSVRFAECKQECANSALRSLPGAWCAVCIVHGDVDFNVRSVMWGNLLPFWILTELWAEGPQGVEGS